MSKIQSFGANFCESARQEVSGAISIVGCMSGILSELDAGPFVITAIANCLPKEKGTARVCVVLGFEDESGEIQEQVTIGELEIESMTQTYLPAKPIIFQVDKPGFIYCEAMELPADTDLKHIGKDTTSLRKHATRLEKCAQIELRLKK